MHTILVALGLFVLVQGGNALPENEPITRRSLFYADAEATFQNDIMSDKTRFIIVFGFASEIIGVGWETYGRCYNGVELVPVVDTSDAVGDGKGLIGNGRERKFIETYNGLMREHLDRMSGVSCK